MTTPNKIDIIITATCMELDVGYDELVSKVRSARLVRARAVVASLARKYTELRDVELAKILNKDRTTLIYYREIARDSEAHRAFNKKLNEEISRVDNVVTLNTTYFYNMTQGLKLIELIKSKKELDFSAIMAQYLEEVGYEPKLQNNLPQRNDAGQEINTSV